MSEHCVHEDGEDCVGAWQEFVAGLNANSAIRFVVNIKGEEHTLIGGGATSSPGLTKLEFYLEFELEEEAENEARGSQS